MIEKFVTIKNVGKFSDYSAPHGVGFKKFTIIYGENASGKTTVSAILRSLRTNNVDYIKGRKTIDSDETPEIEIRLEGENAKFSDNSWNTSLPNIEIFDAFFIAENVCAGYYVDHQHKKKLLQFAIGEEGVKLAQKIVSLDEQIRDQNRQIKEKELEIKGLLIRNFNLDDFLELPEDDEIDKKVEEQRSIISTLEQSETLQKKSLLEKVEIPDWSWDGTKNILSQSLETISKEAEENVKEHIQNYLDEKGEEWIGYGLNHIKDNKCPFCGQNLIGINIIQDYQKYFDATYKDLKANIQSHLDKEIGIFRVDNLLKIMKSLEHNDVLVEFWKGYITVDFELISIDFEKINKIWNGLSEALVESLKKKLSSPLEIIHPSGTLLSTIEYFGTFQTNIVQYNEQVIQVNSLIQSKKESVKAGNLEEANKELIKLLNQQRRYSAEAVRLCEEYKALKDKKREFEEEKQRAKQTLDTLTQNLISESGYQSSINKYLSNFGADFCITNQSAGYGGGSPSINYDIELCSRVIPLGDYKTPESEPSFKNTLSEGDKSTLAFAFFLARLDHDEDIAEKILVFDDPINSLDIHRRNSTIQNILRLIQRARQVIVQTHDPIFARYLWNEADKSLTKCLCLKQEGRGRVIREWDIETETAGEYYENYFILDGFLKEGRGKKITVARCIRPLLEGNLRLGFPGLFRENEWLGDFIEDIRTAGADSPLSIIKPHLGELEEINSYSKQFHHSKNPNADSVPINETELKSYVRRTLKFVGFVFSAGAF